MISTTIIMRKCGPFLIALVAFMALFWVLFEDRGGYDAAPQTKEDQRALRLTRYSGHPLNTTLTVVLARKKKWPSHAHSSFQTHLLNSYSSGRLDFAVRDKVGRCFGSVGAADVSVKAPCLVAAMRNCPLRALESHYPQCMTMVLGDEECELEGFDFRAYYSDRLASTAGYLPLGPRADSWGSFWKIQADPRFVVRAASQRGFAFNAIFSQSTDKGRKRLAKIIEKGRRKSDLVIFASMARNWAKDVNDPKTKQLDTDSYVATLLDSVFTLVPAGHNPESYRLYEAVEAGSIPVLTGDDLGRRDSPCGEGSLRRWRNAPVIVLDSWNDLFPRLEGLMRDPARLDEMQVRLRAWYDEHMRGAVAGFEDGMIRSILEEGGAAEGGSPVPEESTAHPIWSTLRG